MYIYGRTDRLSRKGICFVAWDDLSWDEAQGYCDSLNVFSDEDLVYTIVRPSTETETEWLELISDNAATDSSWIGATSTSPIPSGVDSEGVGIGTIHKQLQKIFGDCPIGIIAKVLIIILLLSLCFKWKSDRR